MFCDPKLGWKQDTHWYTVDGMWNIVKYCQNTCWTLFEQDIAIIQKALLFNCGVVQNCATKIVQKVQTRTNIEKQITINNSDKLLQPQELRLLMVAPAPVPCQSYSSPSRRPLAAASNAALTASKLVAMATGGASLSHPKCELPIVGSEDV